MYTIGHVFDHFIVNKAVMYEASIKRYCYQHISSVVNPWQNIIFQSSLAHDNRALRASFLTSNFRKVYTQIVWDCKAICEVCFNNFSLCTFSLQNELIFMPRCVWCSEQLFPRCKHIFVSNYKEPKLPFSGSMHNINEVNDYVNWGAQYSMF